MEPDEALKQSWRAFLDLCDEPGFRRVVLIDSPNILGRQQWSHSAVYRKASELVEVNRPARSARKQFRFSLANRVMMGAMAEAALTVAEADDIPMAKKEAEQLVLTLFSRLQDFGD